MSANRTLDFALKLGEAGILVFPCRPKTKRPATTNGFKDASIEEAQIRRWFGGSTEFNLAIRCGPQPCGINLVVLDIDPEKGGDVSWKEWMATHDVPVTARHDTPSGGFHLFFDAPEEFRPSASQFAPGIDVRASDSYVVAPPSVAPSKVTGEYVAYVTTKETFLVPIARIARMPDDMREHLVAASNAYVAPVVDLPSMNGSRSRHPSQGVSLSLGDSVADLAREGWDWFVELEADGWVMVRRDGARSYWTRPGKNPRDGSSATLQSDDGPLTTFSSSLPEGGVPAAGAAIASFSPWDYIVTFRCNGDTKAAAALVRGGGPTRRAVVGPLPEATSLYLPDEFWGSTELLSEVRQEALKRLRTPDAVLAALLTMYATTIPMGMWLPGVVGAQAPLNLFAVVAGRSGGGKTSAMTIAAMLMGSPGNADILLRKQLRSGEGLITLVNKPGKKGRDGNPDEPPSTNVGVHVHYDEGGTLSRQQNQTANTIIPYLNTAWSGAGTVGGAKADGDAGFDAARIRICALIGVQYGIGANLFTGEAATLGFPQRLLFLSADNHPDIQNQDMPDEIIEPEPMGLPFLRHSEFLKPVFVDIPRPIRQEVWDWSKQIPDNPLDGHAMNLQLRIATILMLMHGVGDITFTTWFLHAATIMKVHRDVRHAFVASIQKVADDRDDALGRSLGRRQEAQIEYHLDKGVDSLLRKLSNGPVLTRVIKDHFKSWRGRYGFGHREVIDRALLLGLIVEDGPGYRSR